MKIQVTVIRRDGTSITAEADSWKAAALEVARFLGDQFYIKPTNPARLIVLADADHFRSYEISFDPKRGSFGHIFPSYWQEVYTFDK